MEVILRETIDSLGRAGQVIKVADGYARNYLLPRKLAYVATPGNRKVIESERQSLFRKEAKQKDDSEKLKEMLEELEKKGYQIEKRKIHMDDHIKTLGEFSIPIRLFKDVTAHVKLKVEPETEGE